MKHLYKPLCLITAMAAMLLTSCQKETFKPSEDGNTSTITVHAIAEDVANATKTHINGTEVLWDENEEMMVVAYSSVNPEGTGNESKSTGFSSSEDSRTATFTVPVLNTHDPDYVAGVYPASAAKGLASADGEEVNTTKYKVELKSTQEATAASYDPSAYIMITRPEAYPVENNEWTAYYVRATALNCMTLSDITDDIKSVTITLPEGQQAAGRRYFNLVTGAPGEVYYQPTNVITVTYATPLKVGSGENNVWFTSWNTEVAAGQSITVKAVSETKIYTKTITANKAVSLKENYLNTFDFSMSGAKIEDASQATGDGTTDNPYNVAAALNAIAENGNTENVYVKGYITAIEEVNISYGNAEYTISDDKKGSNELLVYRGNYLENSKFTSKDQIKIGDEVVVTGDLVDYNGTYEVKQGNYIHSLNGGTEIPEVPREEPEGNGTLESPYNVSAALNALETGGTVDNVYVKGIISVIGEVSTSYGNATYYISDDGTTNNQLQVYRGYYFNGENFTSGNQIKEKDEVVVYGNLVIYDGTCQFDKGNQIYSINGRTTGDDTPDPGPVEGEVEEINMSEVFTANENLEENKTYQWGNLSVTFEKKNNSSSNYSASDKGVRFYANDILTFDAGDKTILRMEFTSYGSKNGPISADSGTVSGLSWTGETSKVAITAKGQLRFNKITVTYKQ